MLFSLIQILYWLALSTWFGGVLFVAVAAPIIFRTIREADPTLPRVLSVNLDSQHSTLLAGSIVQNLLATLLRVELACSAAMGVALVCQWIYVDRSGLGVLSPLLRTAMYVAAVVLVIYDWRVVWPKVNGFREQFIEHADEPEIANPAKDEFDRYHQESIRVLGLVLFLLLGIVLFSGSIVFTQTVFVAK